MTTQTEISQKNHHSAVRFFWGLLMGATTVSLVGNEVHALLPYIPKVVIQIGAAAVPPSFSWPPCAASPSPSVLVHRAGSTDGLSRPSPSSVRAFILSFRDLLVQTGRPPAWAWILPVIIDTARAARPTSCAH